MDFVLKFSCVHWINLANQTGSGQTPTKAQGLDGRRTRIEKRLDRPQVYGGHIFFRLIVLIVCCMSGKDGAHMQLEMRRCTVRGPQPLLAVDDHRRKVWGKCGVACRGITTPRMINPDAIKSKLIINIMYIYIYTYILHKKILKFKIKIK